MKGWEAVSSEYMSVMAELEYIGIKPVYISHDKDKEFKPKNSDSYNKTVPNVPTGCLSTIVDRVNMVLYFYYDKKIDNEGNEIVKRYIGFRDNGEFVAKSHLQYMPDRIEMGDTPEETVKRIKDAFNKAIEEEFGKENKTTKTTKTKTKKTSETNKAPVTIKEEVKTQDEEYENIVAQNEEPDVQDESETLEIIKIELGKLTRRKLKTNAMTVTQVVETLIKYTGKDKIVDIDDIEKAKNLRNVLKQQSE